MNAANILIVDDEADIRTLLDEILSDEGYRVSTAANATEARSKAGEESPDLILLDIWMPDTDGITLLKEWSADTGPEFNVVMMSGHGTIETAVEATRHGATDFLEKPLSISKLLLTVEKALQQPPGMPAAETTARMPAQNAPAGKSPKMKNLRRSLEALVTLGSPVLLAGESGSGREVCARYIHSLSPRREGPFIVVSGLEFPAARCADALLGIGDRVPPGFLAQAEGGVLFLRGAETLPAEAQRLLAAILAHGSFSPSDRPGSRAADVRCIASVMPSALADPAAHGLLPELLEQLGASTIMVPALRDYAEDVPELLRIFVEQFIDANRLRFRRFGVAAQNRLRNYPWPGNVRELRAVVQRLLVMQGPEEISLEEVEALMPESPGEDLTLLKRDLLSLPLREAREQFEKAYLTKQLALCDGKVGHLAKRVGMERTNLYRKLRALGIKVQRQTPAD